MIGRGKAIFRDVFDMMENYDSSTYWDKAKEVVAKYSDPNDVVFIMDMFRAGQTYVEGVKQSDNASNNK